MSKPKAAKAELPLRGFLICPDCKSNLTGSGSRGKSGRKFFYYHCQRKCKHMVSAPLANQRFEEWLDELSIKQEYRETYLQSVERILGMDKSERRKEVARLNSSIEKLKDSLLQTDKMFVEGKIKVDSYERLKESYEKELMILEVRKAEFADTNEDVLSQMQFAFRVMENLKRLWLKLDLEGKQIFLSSIFPEKLLFEKEQYRTPDGNSVISAFFQITNELQTDKTKKAAISDDLSCRAHP